MTDIEKLMNVFFKEKTTRFIPIRRAPIMFTKAGHKNESEL